MISLAVGVVLGGAFQAVINSAVNGIFLPIISIFTDRIDFSRGFIDLTRIKYPGKDVLASAEAALADGRVVITYGTLITAVINFLIIGLVVFAIVKSINSIGDAGKKVASRGKAQPPAAPTTKECPYCVSTISVKATRCPHCTSQLPEEETEEEKEEEEKVPQEESDA